MTDTRPGWRESLEADPLGLASHRHWDETPSPAPSDQRGALLRLLLMVAAIVGFGFAVGAGVTVLLVLALIACIVAHEFGHYITAKAAGIKVTEFFVGFGPRLWSVRRGETEYGVKGIPLGGYCRILGMNNLEEVDPAEETRTYRHAPLWRRLSVDVAGSAMHFLIAAAVLFSMFFWTGDPGFYLPGPAVVPASVPIAEIDGLRIGNASVASPAQAAGFRIGDRIVAVDGHRFSTWEEISAYIKQHYGQRLDVTVDRSGGLVHLHPVPVNKNAVQLSGPGAPPLPKATPGAKPVGFIGIAPRAPVAHSSFGAALSHSGGAWVQNASGTVHAVSRLFTFHGISSYLHTLSSQKAADNPNNGARFVSPVGVVRLLHQAGQAGLAYVLWLLAAINIAIGIFNLLPLFPLDGGRIVVGLYEGIRSFRRPYRVDVAKLLPVFYLGLGLVLFLGASALFVDLRSLTA